MKVEWKTCLRIGITIFLLYCAIHFLPAAVDGVQALIGAMSSIFVGAIIAYLINILMSFYERHYFSRWAHKKFFAKTRRPVCLLGAIVTLVAVIVAIFMLILPELIECIETVVAFLPPAFKKITELADDLSWVPQELIDWLQSVNWNDMVNKALDTLTSGLGDFFSVATKALSTIFSVIVTTLFAIIFSIYLLSGRDTLKNGACRLLEAYVPKKIARKMEHLTAVFHDCFRRYIVGQCIEAVILGALCTIGMIIFQFPYATMIGALVAFTALIPIAGAYIGAGVGAFMILTVSPIKALLFLVFIIVLQQLEGNIIYPRVVGTSIGLPGIWVLFAVTVGGGLFGVMGMVLGVPLVAAIYRLVKEDLAKKEDRVLRQSSADSIPAELPLEAEAEIEAMFAETSHNHKKYEDIVDEAPDETPKEE